MIEGLKEEIRKYLLDNKWKRYTDSEKEIFYKKRHPLEIHQFDFLKYSKRNVPHTTIEVADRLKDFLLANGFNILKVDNIFGKYSDDPLFLTSGVQNFAGWFHGGVKPNKDRLYIEQPVIRTNLRKSVGEGKISSFVNLSTLKSSTNNFEHVEFIDLWMQNLSKLGLYVSDFNLELRVKNLKSEECEWDKSQGLHLKFKYGGMEIGSAGAIYLPINSIDGPISDIGFGLERVVWAINKTDNFSDLLGPKPLSFSNDYIFIDSLRSLTLLGMSGLLREDKDRFRQFRIYLQNIEKSPLDMAVIHHYYSFWSRFLSQKRDREETTSFIFVELNRLRNQKLLEKLGFEKITKEANKYITKDTDSFINYLVENHGIKLKRVKELSK